MKDSGLGVFSQNDEDGLLLFIYWIIGFTSKACIDLAFVFRYHANTTNLIFN